MGTSLSKDCGSKSVVAPDPIDPINRAGIDNHGYNTDVLNRLISPLSMLPALWYAVGLSIVRGEDIYLLGEGYPPEYASTKRAAYAAARATT